MPSFWCVVVISVGRQTGGVIDLIFSISYASVSFVLSFWRAVVQLIQSLDQLVQSSVQLVRQTGTGVGKVTGGVMIRYIFMLPILSSLIRSLYLACCRHLRYVRR